MKTGVRTIAVLLLISLLLSGCMGWWLDKTDDWFHRIKDSEIVYETDNKE